MNHVAEEMLTTELFKYSEITDDFIFRCLAHKIISEITMDELEKLFSFTKILPNSKEANDMYNIDKHTREKVIYLRRNQLINFNAKLIIK